MVFVGEVRRKVEEDQRISNLRKAIAESEGAQRTQLRHEFDELYEQVLAEKRGETADTFDRIHSVQRAKEVGSIDEILPIAELRPYLVAAIERGIARDRSLRSP